MQGTAGVFSTVNTKEKDRILTDQDRATENDKLEQMQSTVAVVRGGGGHDQDRVTDSNTSEQLPSTGDCWRGGRHGEL